jgi:hypothetical protein
MKLLTIPVPGAAFVTTSTFPKKMYLSLLTVGASVATLIVNSAPFAPYDILVPAANDQSELAPWVKSVFWVVPRAGSEGHVAGDASDQATPLEENGLTIGEGVAFSKGLGVGDTKSCQQQSCCGKSGCVHCCLRLYGVEASRVLTWYTVYVVDTR